MTRRLIDSLMEMKKQADLNRRKCTVSMTAENLAVFAREIERDLGTGGVLYPVPYHGFKCLGISFEPCPA